MQKYLQALSSKPGLPQIATIDCERQPDADHTFDTNAVLGFLRTLRTKSQAVWLLPAPSLQGVFGARGRRLTRDEKIRCSGFEPSWLSDLSDSEAMHATGNTIPPPLAGHVLFPLVRAWAYTAIEVDLFGEEFESTDLLLDRTRRPAESQTNRPDPSASHPIASQTKSTSNTSHAQPCNICVLV